MNCKLTADPGITKVYLGRPWRDFAKVVYLNCEMGNHILPSGWDNWSSPAREKTSFFAEYESTGPGAETSERVSWCHQLSKKESRNYTKVNIFKLCSLKEPSVRDWALGNDNK